MALLGLFAISGFAGLIYESIWSHYLKLFLGHAAYAQTLVLVIFMGGMALGAWWVARRSLRIGNLLLGYAIVELVIGLMGLSFHSVSRGATAWAFDSVIPAIDSPLAITLFKWTLASALILPQSVLLGATFPLMSGAIIRLFPDRSGPTLALLYFTNSLGAAVGVLASGFVLIERFGLPGTVATAGVLNLALALLVWLLARPQGSRAPLAATAPAPAAPRADRLERAILLGALATGAAGFMYEVAWLRMLALVLGSSTHAFELMLSAFILGIALGGLWVRNRIQNIDAPLRFLGMVMLAMASTAMLTLFLYNSSFGWMAAIVAMFAPSEAGFVGYHVGSHAIALVLMVPTTFFCGMTLPIMTNALVRGQSGERAIGAVYAWNTVGAIVGTVLAVHVLMPLLGLKGLMITGAVVQVALGAFYLSRAGTGRMPAMQAVVSGVAAVALLAAVFLFQLDPRRMSSGVFRHGQASQPDSARVLRFGHGKTASISLVEQDGTVIVATNGKPDAAIQMGDGPASADEITMVLAAALPLAMHPQPRHVANIGIGSGLTTHALLTDPGLLGVDSIEIEPEMARAARAGFMPRVRNAFEDSRSHLRFEDAKTFFASGKRRYDIIISEPSNPWVSGVASLFSDEFYAQLVRYLQPDGLLVQWLQIYETDVPTVISVLRALAPHFEDFELYRTDDANLLIVAAPRGQVPPISERVFQLPGLREELTRVSLTSLRDFQARFTGDKTLLLPVLQLADVPANSDYFPFVDQNAIRARILGHDALEVIGLSLDSSAMMDLVLGRPAPAQEPELRSHSPLLFDQQAWRASALAAAVISGETAGLPPDSMYLALHLGAPAGTCAADGWSAAWTESAFRVAQATTALLGERQLRQMWATILQMPCASRLAADEGAWLRFLQAIALRERRDVLETGRLLLEGSYVFPTRAQLAYAAQATISAAVGEGDRQGALQLLQGFMGDIEAGAASQWALNILKAQVIGTAGNPAPR